MSFAVGSLVRARGREWVVLRKPTEHVLILRPLGGTEDEIAGIHLNLETVEPAQFAPPDPTQVGDYRSCRLLRDAVRLSSRASVGPFRSFARIAVEPRPYQLVPLLMALKLDPVRLLIADDVGVGKTIEACLVARELLDRGEVKRLAVLCPPALAEQWQSELKDKFHIDAELVLRSTAARLERGLPVDQSLFDVYPYVVISVDFIKSDRRRHEFVTACPELVIVDEAHTCAYAYEGRGGRHQRHQLIKSLSEDPDRHMILVTATPHSGKEDAFRSLLGLLKPEFQNLPEDLSGKANEKSRRTLAAHFVQRRRPDIRAYLDAETKFPDREEKEETYSLTNEYKHLFERALDYAREIVVDPEGNRHRQRVRWWSALALLRSLASSPAAAAATLRNRAPTLDTETVEDADEVGRRAVMDIELDELAESTDIAPGGDLSDDLPEAKQERRRLLDMAREAEKLFGDKDSKLLKAVDLIKKLIRDGYRPIVFCRFIPTADYVAQELSDRLPKGVSVASVTGTLPPAEREARVLQLAKEKKHVLVCTDCLSEGINLQDHFDAVIHYDLSWNPTRHEQREGRVDRFGQPSDKVRMLTYWGVDNQIDGIVLDVLIRKHKAIRNSLGISVPVPIESNEVVEAIFEGLLLREKGGTSEQLMLDLAEYLKPKKEEFFDKWDDVADREKRSRTMFSQVTIKPDDVARELREAQESVGRAADVESFTQDAVVAHRGLAKRINGRFQFDLSESRRAFRDTVGKPGSFEASFGLPVSEGVLYLSRTHPIVESMASYVMDTALDPIEDGVARRAGAIHTKLVDTRTTALLVRFRYDIVSRTGGQKRSDLVEETRVMSFSGAPDSAKWLDDDVTHRLVGATPDRNVEPERATRFVEIVTDGIESLTPHLEMYAEERAQALLDAHKRVRQAARLRGVSYEVEVKPPADVLGVYVYLPVS